MSTLSYCQLTRKQRWQFRRFMREISRKLKINRKFYQKKCGCYDCPYSNKFLIGIGACCLKKASDPLPEKCLALEGKMCFAVNKLFSEEEVEKGSY